MAFTAGTSLNELIDRLDPGVVFFLANCSGRTTRSKKLLQFLPIHWMLSFVAPIETIREMALTKEEGTKYFLVDLQISGLETTRFLCAMFNVEALL